MLTRFRDRALPCYAPPDSSAGAPAADAASPPAPAAGGADVAASSSSSSAGDGSTAAADASGSTNQAAAPAATDGAGAATPAKADTAAAAAPAGDAAAAPPADAAKPESKPSLLEAAKGKPKADAKAADAVSPDAKPAPADAAKPADGKDAAKAEGDKKPDAKAADDKDGDAAKAPDPAKDATAAQPPAPLKYEAFKVPDGIKLDDKELEKFTQIVGTRQLPQEAAQELVDLYISDRERLVGELRAEQRKTWDTLNDTWKTDLRNDEKIGGNRLETTLSMAKAVVEEYADPGEVRELLAHFSNNGMGNYKPFIRMMQRIGHALNVFEDGVVAANPLAPKMPKTPGNRGWYDKSMGNGAQAS